MAANSHNTFAREVLSSWGVNEQMIKNILKEDNFELERCALIVSIQESLEGCFSNPLNVNGFMGMKNHNFGFEGRRPIEVISTGDIEDIRFVAKCLKALSM